MHLNINLTLADRVEVLAVLNVLKPELEGLGAPSQPLTLSPYTPVRRALTTGLVTVPIRARASDRRYCLGFRVLLAWFSIRAFRVQGLFCRDYCQMRFRIQGFEFLGFTAI